jgi:hypothetical protein
MLPPGGPAIMAGMEIRICLDRAEPPAGRVRVLPEAEQPAGALDVEGIGFVGWLGLLRVLDEVVRAPEDRAPDAG